MPRTVYVIKEHGWEYNDQYTGFDGANPIRAFARRADAETYRRERENETRRQLETGSKFDWNRNLSDTFGGLEYMTTLSEPELLARLSVWGIVAPNYDEPTDSCWANDKWWDATWGAVAETERKEQFWALFDKLRFFTVVPMEIAE